MRGQQVFFLPPEMTIKILFCFVSCHMCFTVLKVQIVFFFLVFFSSQSYFLFLVTRNRYCSKSARDMCAEFSVIYDGHKNSSLYVNLLTGKFFDKLFQEK